MEDLCKGARDSLPVKVSPLQRASLRETAMERWSVPNPEPWPRPCRDRSLNHLKSVTIHGAGHRRQEQPNRFASVDRKPASARTAASVIFGGWGWSVVSLCFPMSDEPGQYSPHPGRDFPEQPHLLSPCPDAPDARGPQVSLPIASSRVWGWNFGISRPDSPRGARSWQRGVSPLARTPSGSGDGVLVKEKGKCPFESPAHCRLAHTPALSKTTFSMCSS